MEIWMEIIVVLFILAIICVIGALFYLFLSDVIKDILGGNNTGWHRCYRCKKCGAIYDPDDVPYICKYCGTEITRFHDILSSTHYHRAPDLNFDHDTTENCEIVIARRIGRTWEIMKETEEES